MTATVGGNAPTTQQKEDLAQAFDLVRVNGAGQTIGPDGQVVGGMSALQYSRLQRSMRPVRSVTPSQVTYYVDANRGSNANNGTSIATPYQTLEQALAQTLTPGAVIALANDSVWNLADRISFSGKAGNASSRLTLTNYDPGGSPSQRPTFRYFYTPTAAQWTWDASRLAWYFTNPDTTIKAFGRYAYVRFPVAANAWGIDRGASSSWTANRLTRDFEYWPDETNRRIYIYAPAGTDPTTYYGGPGSVVLAQYTRGVFSLGSNADYWTIENIRFEQCGSGIWVVNSARVNMVEVRGCIANDVGGLFLSDGNAAHSCTYHIHSNTAQSIGGPAINMGNSNLNCIVEDNVLIDGNNSACQAAIYINEYIGDGSQTAARGGNIVRRNFVRNMKNGIGDQTVDGSGIYIEQRSANNLVTQNIIEGCGIAIQDNSGRKNTYTSNLIANCNTALAVTDASNLFGIDVTFDNNTAVASAGRLAHPYGPIAPRSGFIYVEPRNGGANQHFRARGNVICAEPAAFASGQAIFRYDNGLVTKDLTGNTVPVGPAFGRAVGVSGDIPDAANTQRLGAAATIGRNFVPDGVATMAGVSSVSSVDLFGDGRGAPTLRGAIANREE